MALGDVDFSNLFSVLKEGTPAGPYAALVEAQEAGAVTINYGLFINTIISFLIVAFAVFLLIRFINNIKRKEEEEETLASPEPSKQEVLLTEIRDILKTK